MKKAYIKPAMEQELVVTESMLSESNPTPGLSGQSANQGLGMSSKSRGSYDESASDGWNLPF